MKPTNEALQVVRRHGAEHVMYCLSLKPDEMRALKQDDPEEYKHVMEMRNAVGRQLARNTRNVSFED